MDALKKALKSAVSFPSGFTALGFLGVLVTATFGFFEVISKAATNLAGTAATHDVYLVGMIVWASCIFVGLFAFGFYWIYGEQKELRTLAEKATGAKEQQLREAYEEVTKEREKVKTQSEECCRIYEQRKTEMLGREAAERERDAKCHQVSLWEEWLLKMKIPLQGMRDLAVAPLKVQALENIGSITDELTEERKVHEDCKADLQRTKAEKDQLMKDSQTERDEHVKFREELRRERDEEKRSKVKAQQRVEELDKLYTDEKTLREKSERSVNTMKLQIEELNSVVGRQTVQLQRNRSGWLPW